MLDSQVVGWQDSPPASYATQALNYGEEEDKEEVQQQQHDDDEEEEEDKEEEQQQQQQHHHHHHHHHQSSGSDADGDSDASGSGKDGPEEVDLDDANRALQAYLDRGPLCDVFCNGKTGKGDAA
jgi:G3E family GTPase